MVKKEVFNKLKLIERMFNKKEEIKKIIPRLNDQPWADPILQDKVREILKAIGEDPTREGLLDTPKRFIKYLWDITHPEQFNFTTFQGEGMDQMIVQNNIPFYSTCEHHIATFKGLGAIAYIPNKKIVGLSKLARTLEYYSKGLQNQERITIQVADRLMKELKPKGVAVMLKAQHMCMEVRGVKKHDTWTTTSAMRGSFLKNSSVKEEFLKYIN